MTLTFRIMVLLLAATVFAQGPELRISADEAAKHLLTSRRPDYPPLADAARIQGIVVLEIRVGPSGSASVNRLISGHPMLAPAAISAVNQWKYQPFEDAGKPVPIKTLVTVPFGGATQVQSAEVREELIFENDFWTQQDAAEAALAKGDLAQADQSLARAGDSLSAHNRHGADANWQWMVTTGQVRMLQKRYEEDEKQYKNALSLSEKTWDKDAPQVGASQANLAALFAEEKRYDPAHDYASRSFATFEKNFKRVESGHSGARQVFGRAAAKDSLLMAKIAKERNDAVDLDRQCQAIQRFQEFLSSDDQTAAGSLCQKDAVVSGTKP